MVNSRLLGNVMNINTMGMEPLIRLQNLSAPSLNMELFSVIHSSLRRPTGSVFRHARTFRDLLIIVKNDTLYENSPMKRHLSRVDRLRQPYAE